MWTDLFQLTIIPVLLIALTGWFILREDTDRTRRHFLLFLPGAGVILLLAALLGSLGNGASFVFELPLVVVPALIGILMLIVLNLRWFKGMDARTRVAALLLMAAVIILLGLLRNSRLDVTTMVLPEALILFLIWWLGLRFDWVAEALGLTALGALLFFRQTAGSVQTLPMWVSIPFGILYFLAPIFLVVVPAVFLTRGLQQRSADGQDDPKKVSRARTVFRALLAFIMLAALTYTAFWGGIWDQTMDLGLGFMISPFGSIAAIVAGLVMTLTLRGKFRLVGLLYILLVPFLLLRTYDAGMNISHHTLTEERAEKIAQALEQFHAREGYFPESLDALTPRDLLYIPQPIILLGETWCYRGAQNYYQLAAIYREYWSMPLSLRTYASEGTPPAEIWSCEERLAEMKKKYYSPMEDPNAMQPPTPMPLPTSVVTTQRETVQPIVRARAVSVGTWSPDGMYLIFGLPEISGDQSVTSLSFLKADTGEVCPVGGAQQATGMEDGVREHVAWLPDGRLLYVPSSGDMTIHTPCEPDSVSLTDSYPVTFTHALDYHEGSGRVLLKNQTSFWMLDGASLEATQIPNVTPNPFDLHWDHVNWSPEGNRLAISRLNGRTAREGSTLFIVNGATGAVEHELPMEGASDQSAPFVIWASEDELLFNGDNALFLIDFRATPPKFINVLRDIFLLDISYPNDVSTFAWEGHHISIRVNHPRNQGIYIYHPETGQVEILQPKSASPLLFFPNGEMVEMANYIGDPPAEDTYELIWVDAPGAASPIITVQGHLPRNYPNLFPRYLPESSQLAFSSSQGVSVISIPDGETLGFWQLGSGGGFYSYILPPSAYEALVVVADGDGLYYIPLP